MKKSILIITTAILLSACATPMTTLQDMHGRKVTCGGSSTAAFSGGIIGYNMQKRDDKQCVSNFENNGYAVISAEE